jgi:GTPase SAR1 family protein
VGLVGVSSSGKSTLLNAILGDDILPTAVRPSSGTLITCSKGQKVEARVYFENGDCIEIPKEKLKEELQKYGDESFNQENKYRVKIIDVKSPHFLFPETIQIIDSPGLDAHGLERHEQITMELLLPTVDLCMYVSHA